MKNKYKEIPLQNLSFLIPARKYEVQFDITKKLSIPALIECSIKLISEMNEIIPKQLQEFFGLNALEREILIEQILNTGWVNFDQKGNLVPSKALLDWSHNDNEELILNEIFPCREEFTIDLLTKYIQPRSSVPPEKGLPRLLSKQIIESIENIENIFVSQFIRFKDCVNTPHVKDNKSNLYKVKNIKSVKVTEIILSIELILKFNELSKTTIDANIIGYNENNTKLILSSGLLSTLLEYISTIPQNNNNLVRLSLQDYSDITKDYVIIKHYNLDLNFFDIETYLINLSHQKHRIIGPIYKRTNEDNELINHLKKLKNIEKLNFAIWKPANVKFFGASLLLKEFIKEINSCLEKFESEVITLFPDVSNQDNYQIKELYKNNRIGNAYFIDTTKELDESEIFVLPGANGFAFCQYHVTLDPKLGFPNLTIPIGYFTADVDKVEMLWKHVRQYYTSFKNFELQQFSYYENKIDHNHRISMIINQLKNLI